MFAKAAMILQYNEMQVSCQTVSFGPLFQVLHDGIYFPGCNSRLLLVFLSLLAMRIDNAPLGLQITDLPLMTLGRLNST